MQPDLTLRCHENHEVIDQLADRLFDLAGDENVRVIEALAAVFANRHHHATEQPPCGLSEAPAPWFNRIQEGSGIFERRAICRRVARRALRGSLVDPTRGANAIHRIDESPEWCRDLLPIGVFGSFLFYRLAPASGSAENRPLFEDQDSM